MYISNFNMMENRQYSLTELEGMIPFEREIYMTLLSEHVKEENRMIQEQKMRMRSR